MVSEPTPEIGVSDPTPGAREALLGAPGGISPQFSSLWMVVSANFIHPSNYLQKDKEDNFRGCVYFHLIQKYFSFSEASARAWNSGIIFLRSNRTEHFLGHGWPPSLEHTRFQDGYFYPSFSQMNN